VAEANALLEAAGMASLRDRDPLDAALLQQLGAQPASHQHPLDVLTPRTNLPTSPIPFIGREKEMAAIQQRLSEPQCRLLTLVGPGGIGKTSLAVRAAYDAPPEAFEKIVFVSLKSRELNDGGIYDVKEVLIGGLAELFNELARELRHAEIARAPEPQRPRMLLDALRGTRTLLVLDNLESLDMRERDLILTFVQRLPMGCKAILTSRVRIGSAAEELMLEGLSQHAGLSTLAKLAESNFALAKTTETDRLELYKETDGKPLLLHWAAGQIGHGNCLTVSDAITYLRSCPEGNDPLEFIFGDLVEDFSQIETRVLCSLSFFTLPARVEHLCDLAGSSVAETEQALRSLVNRSLVVPSEETKTFALVPLVADFLRKKTSDVVLETGQRLEELGFDLVVKNGFEMSEHFPILDTAWPTVAAALSLFLAGPNDRLQTVCNALFSFCYYSGRYDELLALNSDAEKRAVSAGDYSHAGWRAYQVGWIHLQREQWTEVLTDANRAEAHWIEAQVGPRERAIAITLRGHGYKLAKDSPAAISSLREALALLRTLDPESADVANSLNSLADAERVSGDLEAAERDYAEAIRIYELNGNTRGVSIATGNLAELALDREHWADAESLSRTALTLAEEIGSALFIADQSRRLANALIRQGKQAEALAHAQRAVEVLTRLNLPGLASARALLAECEKLATADFP